MKVSILFAKLASIFYLQMADHHLSVACARCLVETLVKLKSEKREKVEEMKKKTGYYTTKDLVEKYDEVDRKNVSSSLSISSSGT